MAKRKSIQLTNTIRAPLICVAIQSMVLCSCGQSGHSGSADRANRSDLSRIATVPAIRTDRDVQALLDRVNRRSQGMNEGEVDALVGGVNRGVLASYYALHLHYSMDVDQPEYAQYWLDRGVDKGEPNLSLIRASREQLEAAGTKDADAKRKILLSEKRHLVAALDHSSGLTVGKLETVREQLDAVNALLAA